MLHLGADYHRRFLHLKILGRVKDDALAELGEALFIIA
jgi:hypothetical protein